MADLLLFHHALGLTPGVIAFADALRDAGHTVTTPDLYDGQTFATVDDGVAHARSLGFQRNLERSVEVAASMPAELVYIGMSMGNMPAQQLAQTRPGAKAAVLLHGAIPLGEFAPAWPADVPAQVHVMTDDDWGDVDDARALAEAAPEVELFLYPGDRHLFLDSSAPDQYDAAAAAQVTERVLSFLGRLPS